MKGTVVTALVMTGSVAAFLAPVSRHMGSAQVSRPDQEGWREAVGVAAGRFGWPCDHVETGIQKTMYS